jgi:hypothetical protein
MPIWEDCTMTTVCIGEAPADVRRCNVRIDESSLVIDYYDDEFGLVTYRGANDGSGHFGLTSDENPIGRASLHRFPEGAILEGYWIEEGYEAFWRIELNE